MKNYLITFLFLLVLITSFGQNKALFVRMSSDKSKINFNNKIVPSKTENIFMYDNLYAGAGVGVEDINNDGLLDIYFCGNFVKDRLYLNKGNFIFEDITKSSGIFDFDEGWSSSVSIVDINDDGLKDIFVTKELYDDKPELRRNKLYLNQGSNTFIEVAERMGLGDTLRTRGAVFFDYDKDNDLDVFLLHQPPNPGIYSKYKGMSDNGALMDTKYAPRLYENIDGYFYDVSEKANVLNPGFSNAVSVGDLNKDGFLDIVVANDFEAPDMYYKNLGNGKFENIANQAFNHTSYYSMGVDIADINNDGLLDVFIVDMSAEDNFRVKSNMSGMSPNKFWKIVDKGWNYQYMFNALQLNNGRDSFSNIEHLSGVSSTDWSWSPLIADFDNDGLKDIFVSNGLLYDIRNTDANKNVKLFIHKKIQYYFKEHGNLEDVDIWDIVDYRELTELYPSVKQQNKFFKNKDGLQFIDESESSGMSDKSFSNGSAYGDLDNDGDLDLIVNNINEEAFIFKNTSNNNFLRVKLEGENNEPVLGAKVTISYNNGETQFSELNNVRGMYSSSEQKIHFGLGKVQKIDHLKVLWPDHNETNLYHVSINQELIINTTDIKKAKKQDVVVQERTYVTDITNKGKLKYIHKENDFNDFKKQLLLPHKLSQFGPALCVADVNGDGLKDVFVGAAAGELSQLFIQNLKGEFKPSIQKDFSSDISREDIDAVFFDVDNDGDNDLFVVSGGNLYNKGDMNYGDRLYINNGHGVFKKSETKFENSTISGGVVIAADYDNDGDVDLFVGGRLVPHEYPMPTDSRIYENVNGILKDVSNKKATMLMKLGMVTDANWVDFDNDHDMDLIIVGEWMEIIILENKQGYFSKLEVPNLSNSSGWWFSIDHADFDNDGDLDFVIGNIGLNYKYKTSTLSPFDIYFKDFDNNGVKDIVLGYYNQGEHYPLRGFSCSSQQIPNLKKNIKNYDLFASMKIQDVYGKQKLDKALHYKAKTFANVFVENLGNGEFAISKLPLKAQISNINDFLIDDFNSDGNLDVMIVENLFVSEIETPRNDAGNGLILLGDGKNNFKPVQACKSGFIASGDTKKVKRLKDKQQSLIFVVNNDSELQVFKINKDRY